MNTTSILVFVYPFFIKANVGVPCYAVYSVIQVIVGLWALSDTGAAPVSTATKRKTATVAVGYLAFLAIAGSLATSLVPGDANGVRVAFLPSGWGPALAYGGNLFNLVLTLARVVDYAALAFPVHDAIAKVAGAAVPGVAGLFFCVSYSWLVLASVATSILSGGTTVTAIATMLLYGLSTPTFLVTVLLLRWRPGSGTPQ